MAAFNFIVAEVMCPSCKRTTAVRFQTHIASADLDGDDAGQFAGRVYQMGEKMAWFDLNHEEFSFWKTWGEPFDGTVYEYCHGTCTACGVDLYSRIEFEDLRPAKITEVGVADQWPRDPDQPNAMYPVVRSADFLPISDGSDLE